MESQTFCHPKQWRVRLFDIQNSEESDFLSLAHTGRLLTHSRRLMGVMDSSEGEPDKLLKLFVATDPVHLTETGYKAMATRVTHLTEELDTPHLIHVRSLTAGPTASGSGTGGPRPVPRESWTAGSQVVAHRNSNWTERGGHRGTYRGNGHGRSSNRGTANRGGQRGHDGRGNRWAGKPKHIHVIVSKM